MISFFPPCPRIYTLSRLLDTRARFLFFFAFLSLSFLFSFRVEGSGSRARAKEMLHYTFVRIYIYIRVYTIYNERETVKQDLTVCSRRRRRRDEYSLGKKRWMRFSFNNTIEPSFFRSSLPRRRTPGSTRLL